MKYILLILTSLLMMTALHSQDQGMTSTTHEKYVGQIVFTDQPVAIGFQSEIPTLFRSSFSGSDPIYARVYAAHSLSNTPWQGGEEYSPKFHMYDLYINGQQVSHKRSFGLYRHIPESDRTYYTEELTDMDPIYIWTSWRHYVLPTDEDEELRYGNRNISARAFVLALLEEGAGMHQVRMDVYGLNVSGDNRTDVIASGSFEISISEQDLQDLAFKYLPPLPKDEWSAGSKSAILSELADAFYNEYGERPAKIGLLGTGWNEGSYSLTGQKYRKLAAYALWQDKDGDGLGTLSGTNWISDYTNGGWTTLRFDSHCLDCPNYDVDQIAIVRVK